MNSSSLIQRKKNQLRSLLRKKISKIRKSSFKNKNERIKNILIQSSSFKESEIIFCYVSFGNEVDTYGILEEAFSRKKKIYIPRLDIHKKEMHPVRIKNISKDLVVGAFGILEPRENLKSASNIKPDLMIIPGLGFTKAGARLGRGAGYYDRFLSVASGLKVGIAFKEQLLVKIPMEEHDVFMDRVVTD